MTDPKYEQNGIPGKSNELITDFDPPKPPKRNKYAFACAMLASMTSVLLGYEILVGIINLYSLAGSAAAGRTSDWIGRRYTIIFAAAIFFVGAILMGFATKLRFLKWIGGFAGIGEYALLGSTPVYTARFRRRLHVGSSPPSLRSSLTPIYKKRREGVMR
ncbi:hypothetical protein R6Q59_020874 [Mikania micrantha]